MWFYLACLVCFAYGQSSEETRTGAFYKADRFPVHKSKCVSKNMVTLYHATLPCRNHDFKPLVARKAWTEVLQVGNPGLERKIQATAWERVLNHGYVRTAKYGLSWQDPRVVVFEQQEMNNDTTNFVFRSTSIHVDFSKSQTIQLNQELTLCGTEREDGFSLTAYGVFYPSERINQADIRLLKTIRDEQVRLLEEFGRTMEVYCPKTRKKEIEMIFSRKTIATYGDYAS